MTKEEVKKLIQDNLSVEVYSKEGWVEVKILFEDEEISSSETPIETF